MPAKRAKPAYTSQNHYNEVDRYDDVDVVVVAVDADARYESLAIVVLIAVDKMAHYSPYPLNP